MKKSSKLLLLILFFCFVSSVFAQTLRYADLQHDTKPKGTFTSYVSKGNLRLSVGDTITIGSPSNNGNIFNYINVTDGFMVKISGDLSSVGYKTTISSIVIKKQGYLFYAYIKTTSEKVTLSMPIYYIIEVEEAINTGELATKYFMTSDQALAELKKNKDKLDLGLITQVEYDSLKVVYKTFIK